MNENQIVDSSFAAIINAPLDRIDIPTWASVSRTRVSGLLAGPCLGRI